ncbi:SAM_USH1G_HARP domain-containing protein Sans isoform X1 [Tachypleus tridentatus]|uniref:SAM_USH1G_HARP domain-containing protein Sans isoform X1 n=2 Tax=Tachypleus tridentatus TaxID=6853 RepID=UPI003FD32FD9
MSILDKDKFHRAARDGYLDLLREATRKDCNSQDEDGMTPTLWAAYYGQLEALRLLVGRGGDPDKCDYFGNTALHCATANGHMNCVSFLVNFGVNLWAMDNDFHTAKDIAAINQRNEILKFLDQVLSRQSMENPKTTQKMKEKAVRDTEKRVKHFQKIQKKATKQAEKSEKQLERQRQRMSGVEIQVHSTGPRSSVAGIGQSLRKDSRLLYISSPKYSDIVNSNQNNSSISLKKGLGAVSRKVQQKKQVAGGDFKVRELETDGKQSVRSLSGLRRDSEVMYVPKYDSQSMSSGSQRKHMKDVFNKTGDHLSRAASEPDLLYTGDSGIDEEVALAEPPSIFERPGFGSVAFRNSISGALLTLPKYQNGVGEGEEYDSDNGSHTRRGSGSDSIGSAGSLAHRNQKTPWDEDELNLDDDETDTAPIILFLAASGLNNYIPLFSKEKIDLESLMLLTDEDLKNLGLPLGPRRKLANAIEQRKSALKDPGEVADSKL